MSCTYTRTWPKYPDAEISGRAAAATSPAAAADAATNARAAAPAAVGNAVPRAAAAATDTQRLSVLPEESNYWDERQLRHWLRALPTPPSKVVFLLRKADMLSGVDIPGLSADITTEDIFGRPAPPMSDSDKQLLTKKEYNELEA